MIGGPARVLRAENSPVVWIAVVGAAVAVGGLVAFVGPLAAPIGIAAVIVLLGGTWIATSPVRAITVYAFLLPLDVYLSTTLRMTSTQAFQGVVLLATAGAALLSIGTRPRRRVRVSPVLATLGVGLIAYLLLSLTWSVTPETSARSLVRTVTAMLMAALAAAAVRDRATLRQVLSAAAAGALLTALYGYAQFVRRGYDPLYQYFSPFYSDPFLARGVGFSVVATFANPNILAGYGAMVLPLVWALAVDARGARRFGWFGIAAVISGAVVLTFSKTGWLLVVLLAALWLVTRVASGLRLAFAGTCGIALGVALLMSDRLVRMFDAWFPNAREVSVDSRLGLWRASLEVFVDNPLLGFGLDGFAAATAAARTGVLADLLRAHNIYLQTLVDIGIVGTILFWAPLVVTYLTAIGALLREPVRGRDALHLGLILSATGFFLFGVVETLNVSNGYVNSYWLVFGLLAASTQMHRQAANDVERAA